MPRTVRKRARALLTDVEREVMDVLWGLGEATVQDVLLALPARRRLARTSVSTMLRILERKRIVASRREGRSHVYRPLVEREEHASATLRRVVETVFDGSPSQLVRFLLDEHELTAEELRQIRRRLDEKSKP